MNASSHTDPAGDSSGEEPSSLRGKLVRLTRFGEGGAGRQVAQLGGGTAVVMVLQFVTQWICGSLYTPGDWGRFGEVVSCATIIAMAATLRLEMAIPLAGEQSEADDLGRLTLGIATLVSAALIPLCLLVVVTGWAPPEYRLSLVAVPFVVWSIAAFQTLRSYQSRRQQFRAMSDANVSGTALTSAAQVGLAWPGLAGAGLGVGYGAGRLLSAGMMLRRSGLPLRGRMQWGLVSAWRQFPVWILLPALANAVTVGAVSPLISAFYGVDFAGQFNFSQRLLSAPVALLGQAVASVFYVRFAAMERTAQDTSGQMVRLATALLGIAAVIFVPVALLSREAFLIVPSWGTQWETAGYISACLAPWLMFSFVSMPLSGYATVKNRVRRLFVISCLEAGVRIPALGAGLLFGDAMLGVQLYSVAGLVICLYWTLWVMRLAGASRWTSWRVVAFPLMVIILAWVFAMSGWEHLGQDTYVLGSILFSVVAAVLGGVGVMRALRG